MKSRTLPVCATIALVLVIVACGGGSGGAGAAAPGATATIGPDGGTIEVTEPSSPLFGTKMVIPPGALDTEVTFSIDLAQSHPPLSPSALKTAAPVVNIQPDGTTFLIPASLRLTYSDNDNDGNLDGTSIGEQFLVPATAVPADSNWVPILPTSRNFIENTIDFEVSHLSVFGSLRTPKLEMSPIRIFFEGGSVNLSPADNQTAKETIFAAMANGPWKPMLDCLGWRVAETTQAADANIIVRWRTLGFSLQGGDIAITKFVDPDGLANPLPGRFEIEFNESIITEGPGFHIQQTLPVVGLDLFSNAAHEFAHALGLPPDHLSSAKDEECSSLMADRKAVVSTPLNVNERRDLTPFDEAFFVDSYPFSFDAKSPVGMAAFGEVVSVQVQSTCGTSIIDVSALQMELSNDAGFALMLHVTDLQTTLSPDMKSVTVSYQRAIPLPEGEIRVLVESEDVCDRRGECEWTFMAGPIPDYLESWESSPFGTFIPGQSSILGDTGTWFLEDTVSEFPEDCGLTPHRAEILPFAGGKILQLTSVNSGTSCADNIYVLDAFNSIPLQPGTTLSFVETGELVAPSVNPFNDHLGDRIYLGLEDNAGHTLLYTMQHAPGLQPFDGTPAGIYDVDLEIFVEPRQGSNLYVRDVFADFSLISGFNPVGARITSVVFEISEHGIATIDKIAISSP